MSAVENKNEADLVLSDKTGALLMLNKEERKLIKELLLMSMSSDSVRAYIIKKLGKKYMQTGEKLLKSMGSP